MSFTAAYVMQQVGRIVQDVDAVRWSAPELADYINDGLNEIVRLKPNAHPETITIDLTSGTKQTVPAGYLTISRAIRNIASDDSPGRMIDTLTSLELMNDLWPGWHTTSVLPFRALVAAVVHDIADPRTFYVAPGNDGTGRIEAMVGSYPTAITLTANSDPTTYTETVDIADVYRMPLVNYVTHRCYAKDALVPGAAERSAAHLALFNEAIIGFAAVEAATTISGKDKVGET